MNQKTINNNDVENYGSCKAYGAHTSSVLCFILYIE